MSLEDCVINLDNRLIQRTRIQVPKLELLRTGIIQIAYLFLQTGYLGQEEIYRIVAREQYQPKISNDIRRFVQNCELCRKSTPQRDRRYSYLYSLLVPSRTQQHLTVDFITGLPLLEGKSNLIVVKDRLSKATILILMQKIESQNVAQAFVREVYRYYSLSLSITSNRGL